MTRAPDPDLRLSAVFAHPGHELFVLHWIERYRPRVSLWTDGSGRAREPRVDHAGRQLAALGAPRGALFGEVSDATLYRRLLDGDDLLLEAAEKLLPELSTLGLDAVLADPYEGLFLAHDLCRLVVGAVAHRVGRARGRRLPVWVYGEPGGGPERSGERQEPGWTLEHPDLDAKLATARSVPSPAFQTEIDWILRRNGADAFRQERLFEVDALAPFSDPRDAPIHWEAHGAKLVAGGVYAAAVRWDAHVAPAVRRLLEWARA